MSDGVRKDEEFSGTKPVEERHQVDEVRLDDWMAENVEGYRGPLTVLQFKGGSLIQRTGSILPAVPT